MMSLSTFPAPTEGSWLTSPTRIRAALPGYGLEEVVHQEDVDHGGFVDDQKIACQGVVLIFLKTVVLHAEFQQAVDGLGNMPGCFLHAFGGPPGRGRQKGPDALRLERIFNRALIMVVLPVPGPPVMTMTLLVRALLMASAWLGARSMDISCCTHARAFSDRWVRWHQGRE
jgi:hypothetical protein